MEKQTLPGQESRCAPLIPPSELPLTLASLGRPRPQGGACTGVGEGRESADSLSQARSLRSCKFLGQMALTSCPCLAKFGDMTRTHAL